MLLHASAACCVLRAACMLRAACCVLRAACCLLLRALKDAPLPLPAELRLQANHHSLPGQVESGAGPRMGIAGPAVAGAPCASIAGLVNKALSQLSHAVWVHLCRMMQRDSSPHAEPVLCNVVMLLATRLFVTWCQAAPHEVPRSRPAEPISGFLDTCAPGPDWPHPRRRLARLGPLVGHHEVRHGRPSSSTGSSSS